MQLLVDGAVLTRLRLVQEVTVELFLFANTLHLLGQHLSRLLRLRLSSVLHQLAYLFLGIEGTFVFNHSRAGLSEKTLDCVVFARGFKVRKSAERDRK